MSDILSNSSLYKELFVTKNADNDSYNSKFLSTVFVDTKDVQAFADEFYNTFISLEQWVSGNPSKNITNIIAFPLITDFLFSIENRCNLVINRNIRDDMYAYAVPELINSLFRVAHIYVEPTYSDFRKHTGYTRFRLFLPYFGYVELKADDIVDKWIEVLLKPDFTSGRAMYIIGVTEQELVNVTFDGYTPLNEGDKQLISASIRIIETIEFQLGVELPVGSNNGAEVARNLLLSGAQAAFSVAMLGAPIPAQVATATATTTSVRNIKTKNPQTKRLNTKTKKEDTKTSTRTTTYDNSGYIKQRRISDCFESGLDVLRSFNYDTQKNNPSSPSLAGGLFLKVHLIEYIPNYVEQDENFNRLYGRPLGTTRTLNTITGYTEISSIHIEGDAFKTATTEEIAMLEEELTSGIFL